MLCRANDVAHFVRQCKLLKTPLAGSTAAADDHRGSCHVPVHEGIGPLVLRRRSAQERWEGDDGNARAKIVAEHVEFQP